MQEVESRQLIKSARGRFRHRLGLEASRLDSPYRTPSGGAEGEWLGLMDAETWSGRQSVQLILREDGATVRAGRGPEEASVRRVGHRLTISCATLMPQREFHMVLDGDEMAGYWRRVDESADGVGEVYLVRRAIVPAGAADAIRAGTRAGTFVPGAIVILLVFLMAALEFTHIFPLGRLLLFLPAAAFLAVAFSRLGWHAHRCRRWAQLMKPLPNVRVESTINDATEEAHEEVPADETEERAASSSSSS